MSLNVQFVFLEKVMLIFDVSLVYLLVSCVVYLKNGAILLGRSIVSNNYSEFLLLCAVFAPFIQPSCLVVNVEFETFNTIYTGDGD